LCLRERQAAVNNFPRRVLQKVANLAAKDDPS